MTNFGGACWNFQILPKDSVETNVTQRDQFEGLTLAVALVREVIQNSMDAQGSASSKIRVSFDLKTISGQEAEDVRRTLSELDPHLAATSMRPIPKDGPIRILTIEDFGTKGLTGKYDDLDDENFRNFWRRHGMSVKKGSNGGRWGLGKLVFSSSSEISSFFGFTIREGDPTPLLMGQAVLESHTIDGNRHPSHGFWHKDRGDSGIQLPITDKRAIMDFGRIFGLERQTAGEPGLSIVVPFARQSLTEADLVAAVVENYYFPIMDGKLDVEIGDLRISAKPFERLAEKHARTKMPYQFIKAVSDHLHLEPDATASTKLNEENVGPSSFDAAQLSDLLSKFDRHGTLHVRLPVDLHPSSGGRIESHVDVFLRKLHDGETPFPMIVRGSITVPGESSKYKGYRFRGALVARDEGISAFLGDAENPSHTNWANKAGKLSSRWRSSEKTITSVKRALKDLHDLLVGHTEKEDRNALLDVMYLPQMQTVSHARKKGGRTMKEVVSVPQRERSFRIEPQKAGFSIVPGPGSEKWDYPRRLKVRLAYDTLEGDPFKRYSEYDFDIRKPDSDVVIKGVNAEIDRKTPSTFIATLDGPDFKIVGSGFDSFRDIAVKANAMDAKVNADD